MPSVINGWRTSILLLFCILMLISLPFILLGLCYRSTYSTVGSIRVLRLIISYEILILIILIFYKEVYGRWEWNSTINEAIFPGGLTSRLVFFIPILVLWLMEFGGTPFDLAKGESELVSRFNVEYGRWRFLLFFFSEMIAFLVMSIMFSSRLIISSSYLWKTMGMVTFVVLSL